MTAYPNQQMSYRNQHPGQPPHSSSRLPANFKYLDVRCLEHPQPVAMRFIGWGVSGQGSPTAIYACPHCNYREGYTANRQTGQPHRLFGEPPR